MTFASPVRRMRRKNWMTKKLVYADDVKDLLKGLSELPWDEEVDYLVDSLPSVEVEVNND